MIFHNPYNYKCSHKTEVFSQLEMKLIFMSQKGAKGERIKRGIGYGEMTSFSPQREFNDLFFQMALNISYFKLAKRNDRLK